MKREIITRSPAETEAFGAAFAKELKSGDFVAMFGDLGAGKTAFVRGAMKTLGAGALLLAMLASCGGPEILGVIPVYNGPTPTSTTYEFNKEDFLVIVSYADGTDKELEADEFEVVVEGMEEGYYILNIVYEDQENECYVPMDLAIYPSDMNP
jgi:hypothetical protein